MVCPVTSQADNEGRQI